MSKVDAMRALKQARLEQLRASAPAARPAAPRPIPSAVPAVRAVSAGPAVPVVTDADCGHRNMGGRSCTRPAGHGEKSHRYG
jgi:hypothetical protein